MVSIGMPLEMVLVFLATIVAGCMGAVHYIIVHVIGGKPFKDELEGQDAQTDIK